MGTNSWTRGAGILYTDYFAGKTSWAEIVATIGISEAPNCLTHTSSASPGSVSEAERFANQKATESSISSQHLKGSAVPNTCPKTTGQQYEVPLESSLPCQQPQVSSGKISPPSFSHELIPVRSVPSPCRHCSAPQHGPWRAKVLDQSREGRASRSARCWTGPLGPRYVFARRHARTHK